MTVKRETSSGNFILKKALTPGGGRRNWTIEGLFGRARNG